MRASDEGASTRGLLTVVLLAGTLYSLTQTLIGPALPAIAERLDVSVDTAGWLFTGFLISASVATPLIGRLGDTHDRGRLLALLLVVFAAGAVLCALTDQFAVVLAGRVLQGLAGGVFPLAFGLVKEQFPAERVGSSIGLMGTTFGVGGGVGLPLSGLLVDQGGVVWVFLSGLLALPVAAAAWWCVPRRITPSVPRAQDWPGTLLLSTGLVLLLLGMSRTSAWGLTSSRVVALTASGLLVLVLLVRVELRRADPLLDVRVLGSPALVAINAATLLMSFTLFANFLVTPQLAQVDSLDHGLGFSVLQAGFLMVPLTPAMLIAGPLAGMLVSRLGGRVVLATGGACAGLAMCWLVASHSSWWDFLVSGLLLGTGGGFVLAGSATLLVSLVPEADVGVTTGINSVARTVGGALGAVVLGAVLAGSAPVGDDVPTEAGFVRAYGLGAAASALACATAVWLPGSRAPRREAAQRRPRLTRYAFRLGTERPRRSRALEKPVLGAETGRQIPELLAGHHDRGMVERDGPPGDAQRRP